MSQAVRRESLEAAALTLADIEHDYGSTRAVKGVSISVAPGEVLCLLGPSGCGKTTMLRIAAGLEGLQKGSVSLSGRLVAGGGLDMPPEQRGIGLVFQDYALFPHLSVLDNVTFGLIGMGRSAQKQRAEEVLALVSMQDYAKSFPHELSGGQQQRVALARALAPKPPVVLLDEPYSGLDARLRDLVRDEILHVLKESGSACLMVTHDSEEAMYMADRIAVMRNGRIEQQGTPIELYCEPANAFVAGFFSEVNIIEGTVKSGAVETGIGVIPARGFHDGDRVTIVIRPEGVLLQPWSPVFEEDPTGTVEQARMLGRTSLIHMSVSGGTGRHEDDIHLHARSRGIYLPKIGSKVRIGIDYTQCYVFHKEG